MELMPNVDMSPPTKIECQASGDWEGRDDCGCTKYFVAVTA